MHLLTKCSYGDVAIHCKAPRRCSPHDWSKHVVIIQCVYNNFVHLLVYDGFRYHS